jgi:hypothetical protein
MASGGFAGLFFVTVCHSGVLTVGSVWVLGGHSDTVAVPGSYWRTSIGENRYWVLLGNSFAFFELETTHRVSVAQIH